MGTTPELMYLYPGWSLTSTIDKGTQAEIKQVELSTLTDLLFLHTKCPCSHSYIYNSGNI